MRFKIKVKRKLIFNGGDNLNFADDVGGAGIWRELSFRGSRARCTGCEPERFCQQK